MKTFHLPKRNLSFALVFSFFLFTLISHQVQGQSCTTLMAGDDFVTVDEDMPIAINVIENDCDPTGQVDSTTLTITVSPSNGLLTLVSAPPYTVYEPYVDFCGADSFQYFICDSLTCDTASVFITVSCINDAPVAMDDFFTTTSGISEVINLVFNDTDVDETLSACNVSLVDPPSFGLVEFGSAPDCVANYSANFGFCGADFFTYEICDAANLCDTAWVDILVNCVNSPPIAVDDNVVAPPAAPIVLDILENDSDPEDVFISPCNVEFILGPANGILIPTQDCNWIYFSNAYCGNDIMMYTIQDAQGLKDTATVYVTMACTNNVPVAVDDSFEIAENTDTPLDLVANDSDSEDGSPLDPCNVSILVGPTNGVLTISGCTPTYTPDFGFCGTDKFIYQVCDSGGSCDQAEVELLVCITPKYMLSAKVYLSGPFDTGLMRDDLRLAGFIPMVEPYTALGYDRAGAQSGEMTTTLVLQTTGNEAIVDWLLLEFRDALDPSSILSTKAVLLRRDGQIVDVNGNFPVEVDLNDQNENVMVAIRHRNHLSTISEACASPCTLDFRTLPTAPGQVLLPNGRYALESGDANGDDSVDSADRSETWNLRNISGYETADVNMDGTVDSADRSVTWNNRNSGVVLP